MHWALLDSVQRLYPDNGDAYEWFISKFEPPMNPYVDPQDEIDACISDYRVYRSKRYLEILWQNKTDHIDSCLITLKMRKDHKIYLLKNHEGEGELHETSFDYVVRAKVHNVFPGESVKIIKFYLIYKQTHELSIKAKLILQNGFKKELIFREQVYVTPQPVCKDDFFSYCSR